METVQHVSPGMPTQAQLSYAPRPTLQYSLSNPATLPLGGSGSFKVSSAQSTSIPYPSYPGSSDLSSRYVQPSSQYNSTDRPSSNSTSSYNENNHSSPLIGRSDRNSTSNTSLGEYMPPKSRAVLNSDHRSSHPSNRINSTDTYPESILNTAYHVDHGAPPNKRIKYNEAVKPEPHQPLRVDTTERTVYNPPVEAISPTLPPPPPPPPPAPPPNSAQQNANSPETFAGAAAAAATETNDKQDEAVINVDSYSCSNKPTELIDLLIKIEDEIRKTDQQIQQLKKKQKDMEENSNFANTADKVEPECEEIVLPKLIQVAKRIYDENWDKARISHQFFVKFGPLEDLPVYNQAPDTEIYHDNKKKYTDLRPFLIDKIRKEKQAKEARDQNIAMTYNKMSAEWKRKLEKIENSQKRKARDLKNREVFEKVFPELRKQREDKERFSRSGGRVRSEADLEEIMDGLQEQELEDKKMRSYAVIPPLMLDSKQRRYSFINNNGLITDLPKVAKENEYYNIWTESEKEIFKEKFLQHPKNFGVIASYLEKKTVCECVAYYYHSKKTEHYKRLLRKSRRTRARNLQGKASGNNASGLANPGDLLYNNTPGVTTRLQREQIQQQQQRQEQPQNLSVAATSTTASSSTTSVAGGTSATPSTTAATATTTSTTVTESIPMDTSPSTNTSSGTTTTASTAESNVEISTTTFLNGAEATTATVPSSSTDCSAGAKTTTSSEAAPSNDTIELAAKVVPDTVLDGRAAISPVSPAGNAVNNDAVKSEPKPDIKKKERRKDDKKKNDNNTQVGDTSEEDTLPSESNDKGTTHPCLVCKTDAVSSRALPRSHAQQYGLREDEVMPGARVCNLCRCKAVRSRYMHCPLPTCPNTKGNRVKRLRTLPCKWADLPVHIKQPVITEFQIPTTATKCCSACFNRIQRRLIQMGVVASQGDDTSTSPTSSSQLTKWTDEEIEALKRGIAEHGTKWSEVSQMVGPSKTQYQCKTFYFNYRKKLGLDVALQEYNKKHFGEERKPTLSTDEEESGSTTSSCDELDRSVPDDSDTASAPSPAMNNDTSEINTEIDLSVNSEGGIGSAVITKTPLMSDMQMDTSSINTSATAISNLPGSTSPLKCTPPVISHLISKEDYDSSATETADEGVGVGVDNENTSSSADHGGKSNANNVGGEREKVMADVIGGLIEFQLNKPSQVPGLSQAPNSISSMVDQNLFECDQRQQKARENSLATLSLVSSVHHPGHCESMKDGVVYLQMPSSKESPREHETGTLDLSMKKPRSPEFLNNHMVHNTQSLHPSSVSKNSNSHPHTPLIPVPPHQPHVYKHPATHEPANSNYYHHQQQLVEVAKITKTGEPLYWRVPLNQPHLAMPQHQLITVKQPQTHPKLLNKVSSPQQLNQNIKLSPKQSPNGVSSSAGLNISMNQQSKLGGSIMHGTPVSSANLYPTNARDGRYDAPLLRQITPPSHQGSPLIKETGSITQGTPVHQRGSSHSNSSAEYYSQSNSKRSGAIPATTFYPNRPHSYNDEQRQHIIMTDFVTSQHLCNMKETLQQQPRDKPYYYPARQGVIQRHNTNPPGTPISKSVSPHPSYPPGHEALGSLVDVAIQQPSLPVPLSHSSSASNVVVGQHKGDKQRLIIQEGLGDRFSRDAIPKERYLGRAEPREPERYSREPPQLHHQQGPPPPPPSHHDPTPPQMQREHQLTSHQLRENHLQREREQRQQELRDQQLHQHYREQQQKLREQEQRMMRDQGKHRELLSQMQPSIRDPHMQPPPHLQQQQQREVDSHQYQRSSSANSRLAPEPPPHARIQQIPTSIYQPHRVHSNPPEQPIDSRIASTINYHREAPPGSVKTDSGRDSARPRQGDSSTVTAASLIDAIITHQINQPSDVAVSATASQASSSPHVPSARPGDKLFQVFPEPDGKLSPLKCTSTIQSRASPDVKSQPPQLQPQQPPPPSSAHQQHSLPVSSAGSMHGDPNSMRDGPPAPRGIGPPTLPPSSSSSQSQHVYMEPQAWKLRRALQHKELEQQSADRNIVRIAGVQRPLSPREKLGGLQSNPLDYVRNKIVEEMHRTSDDEGGARSSGNSNHGSVVGRSEDSNGSGDQPNQPSYLPASNYAYPYSALNINSQVPVAAHTTPSAPPKPVDVPEPTPILSSQYEPLSDED